jgi:hypothetical protein
MSSARNDVDELIRFLRARYDEREALAREAADGDSGKWFMGDKWNVYRAEDENPYGDVDEHALVVYGNMKPQSQHIATHDPDTVLRSIAGKRAIVGMAEQQNGYHLEDGVTDERDDGQRMRDEGVKVMLFEVLHHLAEEFATHRDYKAKDWGEFTQPQARTTGLADTVE